MGGRGERAIGPAPAGLVKYDKNFKQYSFDLKKAEELFKKAWGGEVWEKGFKFTITYNTSGDMRQIASEILKRNVESLNPKFQIDLRGVTWPSFLEKLPNARCRCGRAVGWPIMLMRTISIFRSCTAKGVMPFRKGTKIRR